jgi:zinc transporter ZupT
MTAHGSSFLIVPLLYALLTSAATLLGGALPLYTYLRRLEQRYLIGFAGGAMVTIALFDLIPEMRAHNSLALGAGFFGLYLIEKLVLIHACGEDECETHTVGWGAMIGIGAESLIDGVAIAVGFAVEPVLGILIAATVFIHEVPRGFATAVIVQGAGYGVSATWVALLVDALFTPLGVLLAGIFPSAWFDPLVGFTAGVFLYVGASDLLPEAHRRFNSKVVLSTLLGAGLVPGLAWLLDM